MSTEAPRATAFAGTGEVARLLRELPWDRNVLGPPEGWPAELRTSLRLALESRFPIVVWWGPALVKLYNDAYVTMLGEKHPWALGRPGREVWPEIWDVVGPMLEGVLSARVATWSDDQFLALERHGYPEECYFTFSYSPIVTEDESVEGVFTAVTETTGRVLAHRRLDLLQRVAARGAPAASEEEAVRAVLEELGGAIHDVPFAVLYRVEMGGTRSLGWSCDTGRLPPGALADPPFDLVAMAPGEGPRRFLLPGPRLLPPWPEPVTHAVVAPVASGGEGSHLLVCGLSPRLPWNASYAGFVEVLAAQLAAVLAGARAVELARRRVEAMAELDRAKTAFFSNVSHEFRTPLTLLLGPLEEAREGQTGLPVHDTVLVHRNALRLLDLVNALLDFARLEAGRLDASFAPTDLSALTADVASGFRSLMERAGLTYAVDAPPLTRPVYVDAALYESVLLNLLSNAFKFTREGAVTVTLREEDDGVELTVADTGPGIPEVELPRLFERFHRVTTPQARSSEGAGIGLALTKELVALHGGKMSVESRIAEGSVFRVRLPFGPGHLDPARVGTAVPSRASRAPAVLAAAERWLAPRGGEEAAPCVPLAPRGTVLVVDDNADMREYLARLLSEEGWRVVLAADAEAGLASIEEHDPDLLLADVMLPGMDGFALVRDVRDRGHLHLPVVILSARAGKEAISEGLERGADDYLVKPFTPAELLVRVRTHVELARARRSLEGSRRALQEVEGERARLARDLHDDVGQSLLALRLSLERLSLGGVPVTPLLADVDRMVGRLRAVAHGLRPPELDELGLSGCLTVLARRMALAAGMEVEVDLPALAVGEERALPVYRIVQEALSNAVRHSGAERLSLTGLQGAEEIVLAVSDDGRGPAGPEGAGWGQGLLNMRERARLLGGRVTLARPPGGGTRMTLMLPLPSHAPGPEAP